jgi:hypothetical protein
VEEWRDEVVERWGVSDVAAVCEACGRGEGGTELRSGAMARVCS